MNALELANCIDEDILIDYGQVSDMLRQQQADKSYLLELVKCHEQTINNQLAEIESLKAKLDDSEDEYRQLLNGEDY